MFNFGKLTATPETLKIPGLEGGLDKDGNPIPGEEQSVRVLIFRDKHGVDINDAAKVHPHPFYIGTTDDSIIVSMTDDVEQSQIDNLNIIGIDSDFGFTFGPGGNVYGKKWTGTAIISPDPTIDDIVAERDRRLQLGFKYDFGDTRGVHHMGATEADMRRWMDEVTPLAQAFLNSDQPGGEILIATNTAPVTVTAQEWQSILIAAANYRQPLYQASFALQAMNPIPADYASNNYWPAVA